MTSTRSLRAGARRGPARPCGPRRALAALTFVTFVIGTAELVVVGILELIAADTGVSIGTAGGLVTAYALGIAVGAPILSAVTGRFGRRAVLQASMVAFLAGNMVAAVATSFGLLLAVRVLTGTLHGLTAGLATTIAAAVVAPGRRGQAIAMVVGGITVSTVVGVPTGTLIGQALGWQTAFTAIVAVGAAALAATVPFVPPVAGESVVRPGAQARAALAPRVLAMLAVGLLLFGGQFTAFTYLAPFLGDVTGLPSGLIGTYLLVYGVAATAGTVIGGRAADRSPSTTLTVANLVLVGALGALYLVGSDPLLVVLALIAWGLAGFAIPPALLLRTVTLAGRGGSQAATLGISAVNAGIAAGALVGAAAIAAYGPRTTVLAALVICAVAVPATWATRFLTVAVAGEDRAPVVDPAPQPVRTSTAA